jgi:hypothetical protein
LKRRRDHRDGRPTSPQHHRGEFLRQWTSFPTLERGAAQCRGESSVIVSGKCRQKVVCRGRWRTTCGRWTSLESHVGNLFPISEEAVASPDA